MLYKQAAEVVMTMLKQHLTIGQMDSVGEYMMEHYLRGSARILSGDNDP